VLLRKIDAYGKMGWLTAIIVTLWLAWPIGLLVIAYLVSSGRAQTWRSEMRMPGPWFNLGGTAECAGTWAGFRPANSGNQAFNDRRKQTLAELEIEQREFRSFLEQLRAARDKAEFDAFMTQHRDRPGEAGLGT
jgi:hypothetical protein